MSAPGSNNLLQRRWWASKKFHMEFTFFMAKVSHWEKKMPLLWLLTVKYTNWTSRTQNRVTTKHCQVKAGQPFRISCFTEKPVGYSRPAGWRWLRRWMPQHYRGTLDDRPGNQLFLSFLTISESHLLAYLHFLLTWLILFPSWVSEGVKD